MFKSFLALILLAGCGKYSPAKSPDLWQPKPPKILSISNLNREQITLDIQPPVETVGGYQLSSDELRFKCLLSENNKNTRIIDALLYENYKNRISCSIKTNFVGSLKLASYIKTLTGLPSVETVFIYNKEGQEEAYISSR